MVYSLFDQDEKDKITESFNALGIPTDISVSESQQSTDDVALQNKALEDIIARQQKDEQAIKDDYDSLGSRANRFLQVFGAGLRGENTSQVAKDLRDNLNTRLTNARNKYKDDRDAAFQRVKDTLDRREKLAQAEYDKTRDQAKDKQWEQEFGLKTKTQADQNAIQRAQLDLLRGQNATKEAQAQQDLLDAEKKQAEEKSQLESDLANLFDTYNAKSSGWTKPLGIFQTSGEEKSSARINDINLKAAKVKFGLEGKEAVDFIKNNPDLFLSDKDSGDVNEEKARILGLDPRRKYNGLRINGSKDVIKNGKKIRIYELDNGDGTTTMAQEEIK